MKKPFLIGIAGGSASGKSTFCENLVKNLSELNIQIYHMDDYFKPKEERPLIKAPITGIMYIDDNHPETVDLACLKTDVISSLESNYDVVIIEGLLTLWDDDIYANLDLKLFVDCRADERIVRRLHRNLEWGLTFNEIADVYLDAVRYRHDEYVEPTKWKADFIINGSSPSKQAVTIIAEYIKASRINL